MTLNEFITKVEQEHQKEANPIAYALGFILIAITTVGWIYFTFDLSKTNSSGQIDIFGIVFSIIISLVLILFLFGIVKSYREYRKVYNDIKLGFTAYRKALDEHELNLEIEKEVISKHNSWCIFENKACLICFGKVSIFDISKVNFVLPEVICNNYEYDDYFALSGQDILRQNFKIKAWGYFLRRLDEYKNI